MFNADNVSDLPPMKILKIPKRNQAEKIDWLQKMGDFLSQKEAQEMDTEYLYYLSLKRYAESKGFDSYKEI